MQGKIDEEGVKIDHLQLNVDNGFTVHAFPEGRGPVSFAVPAEPGNHYACLYAIDSSLDHGFLVGCSLLYVKKWVSHPPTGTLDSLRGGYNSVIVEGSDVVDLNHPDSPVRLQINVDMTAHMVEPGVNGSFSVKVPATPGNHYSCVYALDIDDVQSTLLGCSVIKVEDTNRAPEGSVTAYASTPGWIFIRGTSVDPDHPGEAADIQVNVGPYVSSYTTGTDGNYFIAVPAPSGSQYVCIYGLDTDKAKDALEGCFAIAVGERQPPMFVYGTLRQGQEAHFIMNGYTNMEKLVAPSLELWLTRSRDGSPWPWAVPSPDRTGLVGEAYYYPEKDYAKFLEKSDRWEYAVPSWPESRRNYNRVLVRDQYGRLMYVYEATAWRQKYIHEHGHKVLSGDYLLR